MTNLVKRAAKHLSDNSPSYLTGLGAAGLVGTAYLAHKVAFEIRGELAEIQPLTAREKVERYWKRYIPVALVGATSLFCIISSTVVSSRRNLAIAAAASLSEIALREFQAKTLEVVGPNKERQIREGVAQDRIDRNYGDVIIATKDEVACFDTYSGRPFSSTIEKIRRAENEVNAECINGMPVSLNEFYSKIGLPPIRAGEIVGWDSAHLLEVKTFALLVKDGAEPVIAIGFQEDPRNSWQSPFG